MSEFMKYCAGFMQGMGLMTMLALNPILGCVFIVLGVIILILDNSLEERNAKKVI